MTKFKTIHGIVLSQIDYKDVDGIFVVFSKEEGQITIIARGIKKIKSKFKAFLCLGAILKLELVYGNNNLPLLTGVNSIFLPEINEYDNLIILSDALSLTKKLCQPAHILEPVFFILSNFIVNFCHYKNTLLLDTYKIKLISSLGFLANLKNCAQCHYKLSNNSHYFSASGIICYECVTQNNLNLKSVDFLTIKILFFMQIDDFKKINQLNLNNSQKKQITLIIDFFIFNL